MKNGAIFYFLTLAGLTSFWMGCASQSENVTVKNEAVQTKSEFVRMGIPFSGGQHRRSGDRGPLRYPGRPGRELPE